VSWDDGNKPLGTWLVSTPSAGLNYQPNRERQTEKLLLWQIHIFFKQPCQEAKGEGNTKCGSPAACKTVLLIHPSTEAAPFLLG